MTAGGKRTGAGRKPLPSDQRSVAVTVRLRPQVAARFRTWCKARGMSQSEAFSTWVIHLIA
jgi:predicted XRE-type DNA-binding protein